MNENNNLINPPKGWKYIPFGDVFEFIQSNALSREQLTFDEHEGEIFNIHYGDIHATYKTDILDFDKEEKVPRIKDIIESKSLAFLKEGDLVIADASEDYKGVAANLEIRNIKNRKVTGGLHTFVARDNSGLTIQGFRTYILKNPAITTDLKKLATGSKVYGVSKTNLATLKVLLPTEKEQTKIAQILSTWDNAIETLENLIAKKERTKKALMKQLLTGKKRFKEFKGMRVQILPISDFCKTFSGGTPLRSKTEYYGGDIPWLKSGELNNENIYHAEESITEEALKNSSAKVADKGTILLALYGATAGVVAQTHIKTAINQAILAIIPNNKVEKKYLFYYLKMIMPFELNRLLQGGQPNLSADMVKNMEIRIPSIEEQQKIISILISCDEEISELKKHLMHCKKQKQGLMQQLLTGKIRVKI